MLFVRLTTKVCPNDQGIHSGALLPGAYSILWHNADDSDPSVRDSSIEVFLIPNPLNQFVMSDVITLVSTISTKVSRAIQVPSFYEDKYGSYIAIVSSDKAICITHNKKYPSISVINPEHLLTTYRTFDTPIEGEKFWRLYNKTKETTQELVTPYNTLP
jgi:hypothetical protein